MITNIRCFSKKDSMEREKKFRDVRNWERQDDERGTQWAFGGTETILCDEVIVHTCHVRLLKHSKFIV